MGTDISRVMSSSCSRQHCLPAAVPALALALASAIAAPALVAMAAAALQAGGFAGVLQERLQGLLFRC